MNNVEEFYLDNGLRVFLKEDKFSPVSSIFVWVNTGSAYENDSERGLAHVHEHMIFKGTEKLKVGEISKQRIDIMKQTNDGFKIAEEDLKIRGPGEILGKKQSGSPSFYVADLSFDYDLLEDAKIMVEDILSKNPKLENIEGENLRNLLYLQERDAAILTLTAG